MPYLIANHFKLNCSPERYSGANRTKLFVTLMLAGILLSYALPLSAQLPCDCTIRWEGNSSDTWQNGVAVSIPGGGVVGCGQGAGTDGIDPVAGCVYAPGIFDVSGFLNGCFNPDDGSPVSLAPPLAGQKIAFINFDVRQFGSTFQFQINNQSQTVGWVLMYVDPNLATAALGPDGLSGDCTPSSLIADACGINFTGWANSTFTTPAVSKATNYYVLVWNADVQDLNNDGVYDNNDITPQNRDGFNFNFKARYGCGDSDVVLCNLEESFTSTDCSFDGSSYTVTTTVNGANGNYGVTDNTGQAISIATAPSPLILTNLGEPLPVVMGMVMVTYPAGVNYDFTIAENGDSDNPNPLNSPDCTTDVSGTAPECCTCVDPPVVTCPGPASLGCDPELDVNGVPLSLGSGGQYAPDPSQISVMTDAGCSATVTFIGDGMPSTADGCNYTLIRTYQAMNDCGGLFTACTQEFSWKVSGNLTLSSCPGDPLLDGCSTPDEIDEAWDNWIAGLNNIVAGGNCNPTINFSPPINSLEKPMACAATEQQVSIQVFASGDCGQTEPITCTFTLGAYPGGLGLASCPADPSLDGCATEMEIKDAFSAWIIALENMSATGGCRPQVAYLPDLSTLEEPSYCSTTEQEVSVIVFALDGCGQTAPDTCRFTVGPAGLLTVSCPDDETLENCETPEEIEQAFTAWLGGFGSSGGCNSSSYYTVNGQTLFSLANVQAPDFCGGSVSVTIHANDLCGQSASCSATFTIEGDDEPPMIFPARDTTVECDGNGNLADLNAWLARHGGATAIDNCREVSWTDDFMELDSLCGGAGTAMVTFTATDRCGNPATSTATFTIEDTTPPTGACPEGLTGLTSPSQAPGPDTAGVKNAWSDACGSISVEVFTETEFESNCQGMEFQVRHVYLITDDCGNPATCIVIHRGLMPAEITGDCPDGQTGLQCRDEVPGPGPEYIATLYTGADGLPVTAILSGIDDSETDSCDFYVTYEYTIHDNCGNTTTCEVTYSGEDTTPPQGICPDGGVVNALADIPTPDADWIRSFYTDNCGEVEVQALNVTQTGSFCEGYVATHTYLIRDECGKNNTTMCTVTYTVPSASPLNGSCPENITGLQCWADVPAPAEAQDTMELYYPMAAITYIGSTTVNNYCQFTIRHSFSIDDPCAGRIICVLEYSGEDLTPPEGSCPSGLDGLACQSDVPAPDPAGVAAGYTDNCSSVHAYLIETITDGEDCGDFSITYRYNVYDDCDNYIVCEVTHTGAGPAARPERGPGRVEVSHPKKRNAEPNVKAYPNPTSGELFLELENLDKESAEMMISDAYGRPLLLRPLPADRPVYRLNLIEEGLSGGAYLISVRTNSKLITRKVILSSP